VTSFFEKDISAAAKTELGKLQDTAVLTLCIVDTVWFHLRIKGGESPQGPGRSRHLHAITGWNACPLEYLMCPAACVKR